MFWMYGTDLAWGGGTNGSANFSPSKVVIKRELGRCDPARKGMSEQRVNIVVHEASSGRDSSPLGRHYLTNQ